jgi:hypothetical protein
VDGYNPTGILPGSVAEGGTIVIRDHDGWRSQVAAEKRAKQDEEIRAAVARIERGDAARAAAPAAFPGGREEALSAIAANMALHEEKMGAPGRIAAELDATEALVAAMAAGEPPDRDAERREAARARDEDASMYYAELRRGG